MEENSSYPEFTPPAELQLEGDKGESLVQWERKPDGKICIVAMDGVPLKTETQPAPGEESSAYRDLEALGAEGV